MKYFFQEPLGVKSLGHIKKSVRSKSDNESEDGLENCDAHHLACVPSFGYLVLQTVFQNLKTGKVDEVQYTSWKDR